jgi:hypothetical protein
MTDIRERKRIGVIGGARPDMASPAAVQVGELIAIAGAVWSAAGWAASWKRPPSERRRRGA